MTNVKFFRDGKVVHEIGSIGFIPVDEAPVKNSKHLISSGAVEESFNSNHEDIELIMDNSQSEYEVGKFYYFGTTFNLCTEANSSKAKFVPYSVCGALNYLAGKIENLEG